MSDSKRRVLALAVAAVMALVLLFGVTLGVHGAVGSDVAIAAEGDTVIQIAQSSVVHWAVKDVGSDLRDGRIFIYRYKDGGAVTSYYYSIVRMSQAPNSSWTDWTLEQTADVKISIMRYRGKDSSFNHEIELFGNLLGTGFTVEYINDGKYTTRTDTPGRFEAKAVLKANAGYTFANNEAERATLTDRGINLEINPDGKEATMTKFWYVAEYDNALLNGSESIAEGSEVEFIIPSWKFGDYQTIDYPWLYHGDGALREDMDLNEDYQVKVKDPITGDYEEIIDIIDTPGKSRIVDLKPNWDPESGMDVQTNDIVTFYLTRIVDGTTRIDVTGQYRMRSEWSYYINQFMPVGDYELEIVVKDVMLTAHKHWWDKTEHDAITTDLNSESEYKGFTRKFNFSVLPGDLKITNDEVLNQSGRSDVMARRIDFDTINVDNYFTVFEQSEGKLKFEYALKYDVIQANMGQTYWTTADNIKLYFDEEPHLEYNLYRMRNDSYYPAHSDVWGHYITTPSTYTVYYMAKMKNYASDPSMEDRYNSFYNVVVYQNIQTPMLNRNELYYTGGELTVQPKEDLGANRDMSLYTWSGNSAVEVGEYTVTFEFVQPELYKWKGDRAYDFGETFELKWNIKPATVAVPEIADRVYRGGSNIKPAITVPTNQVLNKKIFTITYPDGHSDGNFVNAGTYEITLTLNDKNYVWETGDEDNDGVVTVPFKINPEENRWVVTPRVTQWEWRGYDKTINLIEGAALRGISHFSISFDAEGRKPVAGLEDFTISNGQVDNDTANKLKELNSGTYYLIANVDVDATKNWTALKSEPLRFEVAVARNYWESSPNIIRWKYDGFDASINLITATPHFGETITFSIISKRGATAADDVIVIDRLIINERGEAQGLTATELAKLEAGKTYWLKAVVERKPAGYVDGDMSKPIYNYTEMMQYVEFHIQTSNNYWTQTPNIERWIVGEEPSLPTGIPRWGKAVFVIYDEKTNEMIYNSEEDLNELASAKPGWYRIEATVEGNDNFTSLTSITQFKIFATESNFWNIVPNIQSWREGEAHNAPIGKAAFGEITFTYYNRSDYENNGQNAKKLSGIPTVAGDYVMVAVAESEDYLDLTAVVKFSVYSAAAFNETTYIALVSTFGAVIGILLIAIIACVIIKKKNAPKLAVANGAETVDEIGEDEDADAVEEDFDTVESEEAPVFEDAPVSDVNDEMDDLPALDPTSID